MGKSFWTNAGLFGISDEKHLLLEQALSEPALSQKLIPSIYDFSLCPFVTEPLISQK